MSAVNKTIHEAMGLCWHELPQSGIYRDESKVGNPLTVDCVKCGHGIDVGVWQINTQNPDYTAPVHYCALMDWMRSRKRAFNLQRYCDKKSYDEPVDIYEWLFCEREDHITLIAEAIEAGVLK